MAVVSRRTAGNECASRTLTWRTKARGRRGCGSRAEVRDAIDSRVPLSRPTSWPRSASAAISGASPVGRPRPRPTILAPDMESPSLCTPSRVFRQSHLYKSSRASAMSSTAAAPASDAASPRPNHHGAQHSPPEPRRPGAPPSCTRRRSQGPGQPCSDRYDQLFHRNPHDTQPYLQTTSST